MPIKNDVVYCVNHPEVRMVQNTGFNALPVFAVSTSGFAFDTSQGAPVVVYSCELCGYVELYAAQHTPGWERQINSPPAHKTSSRALEFERASVSALTAPDGPFPYSDIQNKLTIEVGNKLQEVDAIVKIDNKTVVIEVKQSRSANVLQQAVVQLHYFVDQLRRVEASTNVVPVLVVPADTPTGDNLLGVPVLKFDPNSGRFVNQDAFMHQLRESKEPL